MGIINIGTSSLWANEYALSIASQNLANADTPDYTRREVDFRELPINQGVRVADVRRVVDETANAAARETTSNFEESGAFLQQLRQLGPLFDDRAISIGKYITDSLSALEKMNTNAGSTQDRGLFLGSLSAVASRFQSVNTAMNDMRGQVNQCMQTITSDANSLLDELALLNTRIASASKCDVADLLDKRDGVAYRLSKYVDIIAQEDSAGMLNVTLSNGLPLVTDTSVQHLATQPNASNPDILTVAVQNSAGQTSPIDQFINSGQLAGLLNFQHQALDPAQQGIGRLALVFSQAFNSQNQLGMDLNGNLGTDIFNDINSSSAISSRAIANLNNTGSAGITVNIGTSTTSLGQLQVSDYNLTIGAANAYTLTRSSDGAVVGTGTITGTFPQAITADGFTINLNSGTFNSGDQYVISPTRNAANNIGLVSNDPTKLALAWPVAASVGSLSPGSTGTIAVTAVTDTTNAAFSIPKALNPPLQIQFTSPTTYNLVNASTSAVIESGIPYTAGANVFPTPGSYNPGYQVQVSGTPAKGDVYNITYNDNAGGNDNGLQMAGLYQQQIVQGNTLNFTEAYGFTTSATAILTNSAQDDYKSTQSLRNQAEKRRDSISGVSTQQEVMNLARYQQAYEASAQILQTARTVMDTVLSIARR